ncbi:MAG: ATP-binding cassette domain-containing protein [Phycisphaerales bacterium]|nr:ATP-binding cassette domain-containing protein [Phycisphaerales bacterium]
MTIDYGNGRGLFGVSGSIPRGKVVSLVGSNGAGKSTLARVLSLLLHPTAGALRIETWRWAFGNGLPPEVVADRLRRATVGAVLQRSEPWPHMTVEQFVRFPLQHALGLSREIAEQRAEEALEQFGIADRRRALPHQLSGGLQQRVGLAQAVAMRRRVLVLDEVTAALDADWEERVRCMLREFVQNGGTVVSVSHRMGFMRRVSDRVILLDKGRVIAQGTLDDVQATDLPTSVRLFLQNA